MGSVLQLKEFIIVFYFCNFQQTQFLLIDKVKKGKHETR